MDRSCTLPFFPHGTPRVARPRTGLRWAPASVALAALAATSSAEELLVVQPGGTYPTIQAALNAATGITGGTVILVRSGTYPAFTVSGAPGGHLAIVEEPGATAKLQATVHVTGLEAGEMVALRGFEILRNAPTFGPNVLVENNDGRVLIEDCTLVSESFIVQGGSAFASLEVTASPSGAGSVCLARCSVSGSEAKQFAQTGLMSASAGIAIARQSVAVYDCVVTGGAGAAAKPGFAASPGGIGLACTSAEVLVTGGTITGGKGGDGAASGTCSGGAGGGVGLFLDGSAPAPAAWTHDVVLAGGAGGAANPPCAPGAAGAASLAVTGSVFPSAIAGFGSNRRLAFRFALAVASDGSTVAAELDGDAATIFVSRFDFVQTYTSQLYAGADVLSASSVNDAPDLLAPAPAGFPFTGFKAKGYPITNLVTGQSAEIVYGQALYVLPPSYPAIPFASVPSVLVVLDESVGP